MCTAIYPGTFDPVTFGHMDIIERAALQFDHVVIGVLRNSQKSPLFSAEERVNILKVVTKEFPNITVEAFEGLSVNFAKSCGAAVMIRGLRAITDFEYELQMAQTNRILAPDVDTMLMVTNLKYAYLSSTIVKELISYGEDITRFVPAYAAEQMKKKFSK